MAVTVAFRIASLTLSLAHLQFTLSDHCLISSFACCLFWIAEAFITQYKCIAILSESKTMSQVRRSTRKKRQTQLSFTPLPSSSPAASQYAEENQYRPASIRYEDPISSPRKKRRVASSDGGSPFKSPKVQVVIPSPRKSADQLPTPAASSQIELDHERGIYVLEQSSDRLMMLTCLSSFLQREKKPAVCQPFQRQRCEKSFTTNDHFRHSNSRNQVLIPQLRQ